MSEPQITFRGLKIGDEFTASGKVWVVYAIEGCAVWASVKGSPRDTACFTPKEPATDE